MAATCFSTCSVESQFSLDRIGGESLLLRPFVMYVSRLY
jgi:hypothetical protein